MENKGNRKQCKKKGNKTIMEEKSEIHNNAEKGK